MKQIILDTSFILTALKFKVQINTELNRILDQKFSLYYIDKTFKELEKKPLENLAKKLLIKLNAKPIKTDSNKNVDSLIIEHTKTHPTALVATQDKGLKEKLKKRKTALITVRQKSHLQRIN
jgi:rRNA-processing protein FCF1